MSKNKKNRRNSQPAHNAGHQDNSFDRDRMEVDGVVEEALPGTLFRIDIGTPAKVLATLSGKVRVNNIRILPGDKVRVELSPFDLSRGRIIWRG